MNYPMLLYIVGYVLRIEAVFMVPSMLISFAHGEDASSSAFAVTIIVLMVCSLLTWKRPKNTMIFAKEGFAVVALGWIVMSLFGAMPFHLSGAIPGYIDCFFETVSGFTTTGATILADIEVLPKGILFWRSTTHWIGGMGVLLLLLGVMSRTGGSFFHLLRAESPGPAPGKMLPRLGDNAKLLYVMYFALTAIEVVFLMAGGMSLYESLIHAFGTAGTGGFSDKNASVAAFSPYIQWVITIFMLLFGVNFNLYYLMVIRKFTAVRKNTELRAYFLIVGVSTAILASQLWKLYGTVEETLRHAAFQVASIITTTGFATTDFNYWSPLCHMTLLLLMIIGACAGSTGGGVKVSRVIIAFRSARRELHKIVHPRSVEVVKMGGETVGEDTVVGVTAFLFLYAVTSGLVMMLLAMDGNDIITSISASLATISNVGPGLAAVGPVCNYGFFSGFSKILLSFNMLFGRLEIFPMLVFFTPSIWVKQNRDIRHQSNQQEFS